MIRKTAKIILTVISIITAMLAVKYEVNLIGVVKAIDKDGWRLKTSYSEDSDRRNSDHLYRTRYAPHPPRRAKIPLVRNETGIERIPVKEGNIVIKTVIAERAELTGLKEVLKSSDLDSIITQLWLGGYRGNETLCVRAPPKELSLSQESADTYLEILGIKKEIQTHMKGKIEQHIKDTLSQIQDKTEKIARVRAELEQAGQTCTLKWISVHGKKDILLTEAVARREIMERTIQAEVALPDVLEPINDWNLVLIFLKDSETIVERYVSKRTFTLKLTPKEAAENFLRAHEDACTKWEFTPVIARTNFAKVKGYGWNSEELNQAYELLEHRALQEIARGTSAPATFIEKIGITKKIKDFVDFELRWKNFSANLINVKSDLTETVLDKIFIDRENIKITKTVPQVEEELLGRCAEDTTIWEHKLYSKGMSVTLEGRGLNSEQTKEYTKILKEIEFIVKK